LIADNIDVLLNIYDRRFVMFSSCLLTLEQEPQAYNPFSQRWDLLPNDLVGSLIKKGDAALESAWPMLTATDYIDFTRTGNRVRYEKKYFDRRHLLNDLVIAEKVANSGKYLDAIINGVWSICEETGWQLPSHNSYIRDTPQLPLPDLSKPVLDLFACETCAQLALVYMLHGEALENHAPGITTRILCEIEQRIITPYLNEHFWWMGNGDEPMMNWTPWCTKNILICTALTPQSSETRRQIVKKATHSLDCFVKDYGEDGCCDEGAKYYGHAALCLYVAIEMLNGMTDNHFDKIYKEHKIHNIADFIRQVHVCGDYYVNFADCPAILDPPSVLAYLFGKRTNNNDLMSFAAVGKCKHDLADLSLFTRLAALFTAEEIKAHTMKPSKPNDIFFHSVGMMIARDDKFCLAVKGGDNADNHNHNDTGSFTLYVDGKPFIIDIGVGTYTKDTFSSRRYDIWTMQSAYHNLPTFGGVMQNPGTEYKATNVEYFTNDDIASLSMDIAQSYPREAGVKKYYRKICMQKGKGVSVKDEYIGKYPAVLTLMLNAKPEIDGLYINIKGKGQIHCKGAAHIDVEHIHIDDPLLQKVWVDSLYRVLITFTDSIEIDIK